jgi:hypothetical protein
MTRGEQAEMRDAPPRLRRAARRLLEHEAGGDQATAEELAAASGRLVERLSQRLAQVIGPGGVEAIFRRAIMMRRAEFPFLDERLVRGRTSERPGEGLAARLQEFEADVIRDASVVLVATFAGLLATVIGDRLAWSFLRDVWPDTLLPELESLEANE